MAFADDVIQGQPRWSAYGFGTRQQFIDAYPEAAAAPEAAAPAAATTDAQRSAKAIIQGALDSFGLGSLGDSLWSQYLGGAPMEQIFLDIRKTPEYTTRFAGLKALSDKGRAISEAQYIDLERSYTTLAHQFGLPAEMVDKATTDAWIAGEVAPTEVRDRLQLASRAALEAPAEVRDELARNYGMDLGRLTAYYLAPDKALPVLQQQFAAATIGAASNRSGYGNITRAESERLATLGITEDQATKGFGQLAGSTELFGSLDAGEEDIDRTTQLGAAFEGNAAAMDKVNRRLAQRRATFSGGGGFAQGRDGVSGLASAAS